MSSSDDFILQWLNESLNIQPSIKNISKEFYNGYKYALVLNALNVINSEELNDIKDTNNIEEIKSNFKRIKNYLHFKLNLDIREDEFNDVMNKDKSKSTVILYKIKNSVYKKKINFLEIKTSDVKLTKEELRQKINELMDDSIKEEKNDIINENDKKKENEENTQRKEIISNKYTIRKMFDLNPIESVTNELYINNTKKMQKSNELNVNPNVSLPKNINSNNNNFQYNNNRTMENNTVKRNKKL